MKTALSTGSPEVRGWWKPLLLLLYFVFVSKKGDPTEQIRRGEKEEIE